MTSNITEPTVTHSNTALIGLTDELIGHDCHIRFRAAGSSMHPTIRDGEPIILKRIDLAQLGKGDIVLSRQRERLIAHRIVRLTKTNGLTTSVLLQGDALAACDEPVRAAAIVAKVVAVEREGRSIQLGSRRAKAAFALRRWLRHRLPIGPRARMTISLARERICLSHGGTVSHINRPTSNPLHEPVTTTK
jgi:hypothetical protein